MLVVGGETPKASAEALLILFLSFLLLRALQLNNPSLLDSLATVMSRQEFEGPVAIH